MWAARNGSLRTLTIALEYGADPNTVGPDEADTEDTLNLYADVTRLNYVDDRWLHREYGTPLHFAAKAGRDDIVAALLDAGANVHAVSRGVCNCRIHGTSEEGPVDPSGDDIFPLPHWLPLHHAICQGHLSTANLLLDRGAPLHMCYEPCGREDLPKLPSLVHSAAAKGLETMVQRALDTDVRTHLQGDSELDSPLDYALETWDNEGVIKRLVVAGHNLNIVSRFRNITVRRACRVKNYAAALNMLREGANPRWGASIDVETRSLLHLASTPVPRTTIIDLPVSHAERTLKQSDLIRSLIKDHGFVVDEPYIIDEETNSLTPLHLALLHGEAVWDDRVINGHIVKLLLELGADANKQAFGGDDPLTLALNPVFNVVAVREKKTDKKEEEEEEEERDTPEVISDHMLEPVGLLLDAGARLINIYKDEEIDIKYGPLDRVVKVAGPAPEQHQGRRLLEYVMSRATTANITEDELDEFCDNVLQNNDEEPATTILREKRRLFPPEASSDSEQLCPRNDFVLQEQPRPTYWNKLVLLE
ncbi:dil and ankyrin domain-containing protein [Apiospora saccharicola]